MSEALPPKVPALALTLMLVFFVLSGCSGLIYQSVWSQYLGLILGHAAYAQSLVLATFMGGMALGAWLASRYLSRMGSLLRAYGLLEGAIGLFGIGFHAVFLALSAWLFERWLPSLGSTAAVDLSRYVVALALILPQTILLGMTFPVMSAGLIRWMPGTAGRILGGLYFFNSIGAAAGALLATFILIPVSGLPGAMVFAGILNLCIALFVLLLKLPTQPSESPVAAPSPAANARLLRFVLVAALITGWASFMYEIGWVRMLGLALGSSLHTFEMMLAAFIGGLALGGLYIRRHLDSMREPLRTLGRVQVLMGIAAIATLPLYDYSFDAVGWIVANIARTSGGYALYNFAAAVISMVIMVPAAFFAGMTLPLMTYALLRNGIGEKAIGQVYAANTLGAIFGVLLMVHFALPVLGLKLSMLLAASIDIVLGIIILRRLSESHRAGEYFGAIVAGALALALVLQFSQFDPRKLASGVYRTGAPSLNAGTSIYFQRDGRTASVALYGNRDKILTIATNGKPDASLQMNAAAAPTQDEPTMVLLGLLGLAHHPEAKRVAVIGFGSGLTTHTLASSSLPAEITTVEIEPAMVAAARGFGSHVERAFLDPRSQIVFDDARAFFSGHAGQFDVIVSEPSNPWVNGVAKLFSQEFYDLVARQLAADGVLVQWVQAYELSDQTLLSILAALDSRFADYVIYTSNNFDLLIVASPRGALPAPSDTVFKDPAIAALANRFGIAQVSDLRARFVADRSIIRAILRVQPAILNSDYFPIVAQRSPKDRFIQQSASGVAFIASAPASALNLLGVVPIETNISTLTPITLNQSILARRLGLAVIDTLNGLRAGAAVDAMSPGDRAEIALMREWGRACFADADPSEVIGSMAHLFRISSARSTLAETSKAWKDPLWVSCAGVAPPHEISLALESFALALDPAAGAALVDRASEVIRGGRLPANTLTEFYALALVGAARARLPDEVNALQQAIHSGIPLAGVARLQIETVAALAGQIANSPADPANAQQSPTPQ
jgi:predicted membrane-bound spermidine synthase